MKSPEWTKPVLAGTALGVIGAMIVGFGWGGWTTSSAATQLSLEASTTAVAAALTPYCVEKSKADPKLAEIMVNLKRASLYQRNRIIEDAGWATPLGTTNSNSALANACQEVLSKKL